jgi:hypothetical protein
MWTRRLRRNGAALATVLAIGGAVAVHHSDLAIGAMHHDAGGMGATLELCLGVFGAVGAGVAAVAIGLMALARWRPPRLLGAVALSHAVAAPEPRARPGPSVLSLLCVRRR